MTYHVWIICKTLQETYYRLHFLHKYTEKSLKNYYSSNRGLKIFIMFYI